MNARISAAMALSAALAFGAQANASQVAFQFNGAGFNGSGVFTIVPDVAPTDPNPNCGTAGNNACRTDPAGAYAITGVTGTFSDATDGIANATIAGLVPTAPANERDPGFDPIVPVSLSFVDYGSGVSAGALSYDNLFFPGGSPVDCSTFTYTGTFVDDFGVAFTISNGDTVDLWGDGDLFGPGTTTYGVGVTDGTQELAYAFSGVNAAVPEPDSLALLGAGLFGLLIWRWRVVGADS